MAAPIFNQAPEFVKYKGWYLKAYQSGTTIQLDIYLDEAETISVDKLVINSDGFFEYNGETVTPRVGGRYDMFIFPSAYAADNDKTSIAIRMAYQTAAEILLGDGGAIELATENITGLVKFEGSDDSLGSVIKTITNSRDAVKAVFDTLKYTQQDIDELSDTVWITPFAANQMIEDAVIPVTEDWQVGDIIYMDRDVAAETGQWLEMNGDSIDGLVYPRVAEKSIYKSKVIKSLDTVNDNVEVASKVDNSKPVIVRCDDVFYKIIIVGDNTEIYRSYDGLDYSFLNISFDLLNSSQPNLLCAAYDGEDKILMSTNGSCAFYNIESNSFSSEFYADIDSTAYLHFNTRLNNFVSFSRNGFDFTCTTVTKDGVSEVQSVHTNTTISVDSNENGQLTNGNDGSGNISYSVEGFYFITFNKETEVILYKINERFLTDAFSTDNELYNISLGGSPLLDGTTVGISEELKLRCPAVNDNTNFALIDYATDLQTSILVSIDGVFSYKVIDNPFPINNKSGIIPLGNGQYVLTGDNGDGFIYTDDNFDTITSNSTTNSGTVGRVGGGSAILVNESNKFIISMQCGSENKLNYIDIDVTKVSEYATIDLTSRAIGNTTLHLFAGESE